MLDTKMTAKKYKSNIKRTNNIIIINHVVKKAIISVGRRHLKSDKSYYQRYINIYKGSAFKLTW